MSNSRSHETILLVNSNVDVLVLMRKMLEDNYRILLAADAESALRLLTLDSVRIDLVVIDPNVGGSDGVGLRRQMRSILPTLAILPMASLVQDGVIRLRAPGSSSKKTSASLLQRIPIALAKAAVGRRVMSAGCDNLSMPVEAFHEETGIATKVMVAGNA